MVRVEGMAKVSVLRTRFRLEKEGFTSVFTLTGLRQDIHLGYCCACLWLCITLIFS